MVDFDHLRYDLNCCGGFWMVSKIVFIPAFIMQWGLDKKKREEFVKDMFWQTETTIGIHIIWCLFYSKTWVDLEWVKEWWQVSHFVCNFCDYSPYYCSRWHQLAWYFDKYFLFQKKSPLFITDSDLFYKNFENFEY